MPSKFDVGDRVVTCGAAPGFHSNGNFYAPKVYEARIRKKDHTLVWKLSYTATDRKLAVPGWEPTVAAIRIARAYARYEGLPYLADVKDNLEVERSLRHKRVTKPKTTATRKVVKDGVEAVVEEPILVGRFRKIDGDDIV